MVILRRLLVVGLMSVCQSPMAAAEDVATHPKASVSSVEIQAEMAVLAPSLNDAVRRSTTSAQNLAADLLARRIIAEQARRDGLDADPIVAARVRLAAERALYEAYMERASEKVVAPALVERQARDEFRAFPDRYRRGEQVHIRHILIGACKCAPEKTRERADAILARLKAGESFEEIAKAESEDPGSAREGGDLGFFERGKMVPEFENAAFALKEIGELSGLVATQFGIHILRLEARKPPEKIAFEEVRDSLVSSIETKLKVAERTRILNPIRAPGAIAYDEEALGRAVAGKD